MKMIGSFIGAMLGFAGFLLLACAMTAGLGAVGTILFAAAVLGWLILSPMMLLGRLVGSLIGAILGFAGFLLVTCLAIAGLGAIWNTQMERRPS